MNILRRISNSTTARLLALSCIALVAHATEHGRKMVFAHYMVTNQDYQGDTDPTREAKIAAYEGDQAGAGGGH
jgi:hypothetical protein